MMRSIDKFIRTCGGIHSAIALAVVLAVSSMTAFTANQPSTTASRALFVVHSVRSLDSEECGEVNRHVIGLGECIAVRLRLVAPKRGGIWVYVYENTLRPAGYKVRMTDEGLFWYWGRAGTGEQSSSPGFEKATAGTPGQWLLLPAGSAIEWEEFDFGWFRGRRHAFTVFARNEKSPKELVSESYVVLETRAGEIGVAPF